MSLTKESVISALPSSVPVEVGLLAHIYHTDISRACAYCTLLKQCLEQEFVKIIQVEDIFYRSKDQGQTRITDICPQFEPEKPA